MKQGDYVTRKSYGGDIIFRIQSIFHQQAILRGVEMRLLADAPLADLQPAPLSSLSYDTFAGARWVDAMLRTRAPQGAEAPSSHHPITQEGSGSQTSDNVHSGYFDLPGKVLHLDGDATYLQKCVTLYRRLNIPVEGYYVQEAYMADALYRLLPQTRPDIVVITGHDGILKHRQQGDISQLSSYKNSHNFVNAVRAARQFEKNRDALTIIAGACQSHFEALLSAGANFASSPARVLIHALDPLCIAAKVAFTPIRDTVNIMDVIAMTHSGLEGLGGIESRGSYRRGVPRVAQIMHG